MNKRNKSPVTSYQSPVKKAGCRYDLLKTCDYRLMTRCGFTLLELLVSVSILSMATILVIALFAKGVDIWQDARFNSSAVYNAVLFLDSVEKELKNCAAFSGIRFSGEEQTISFPSWFRAQTDDAYQSIGRVKYAFDREKESVYKYSASYPQCLQENLFMRIKVLDSVEQLTVTYGSLTPEQQMTWIGDWGGDAGIPRAVKIKVRISIEGKAARTYEFEKIIYIPIA